MAAPGVTGIEIRPFEDGDEEAVLRLLAGTLGWLPDGHHAAFFAWKHRGNPFGASPAWVATAGGAVIGFRTFLRWQLVRAGQLVRAARAVDTATDPAHQGRGVFSRLTLHGLETLRHEGTAFVFNTPNERSRPGYLKMGWQALGRVAVAARPRTPASLVRMATARTAAAMWSTPCDAGVPAAEALADRAGVDALLRSQPPVGMTTRRSPEYLDWRYAGFGPLGYRAMVDAAGLEHGLALFRLRQRGAGTEATIVELLVPGGEVGAAGRLARRVLRVSGADFAVCGSGVRPARSGFLPLRSLAPIITWRPLADPLRPDLGAWPIALGDVELL